ncbi:SH3 domain-containing protein [uncultured Thermanaerothrix sp.]|uniref:SH3 domain-containing protein n=1 Tax=uncultured Thermanaerothrix sp. TaxID=1195149 RepID=UPI00262F0578|nr:SH3 domain-containing protein [uncultured Thermanaerothrix sp.]
MNLPTSEPLPSEPERPAASPPPLRYLRSSSSGEGKGSALQGLTRQLEAGFDFYLAAVICALLVGAALSSDAPILYFLAVLMSPFLGPVIGVVLVAFGGTATFLVNVLGGVIFLSLILLGAGGASGWVQHSLHPEITPALLRYYGQWRELEWVITAIGAGLVAFLLVRSPRQRPLVVNLVLAYGLVLPLAIAGYGWGSQRPDLWIAGIRTFGLHLLTIWLVAWGVLGVMKLRPRIWGYAVGPALLIGIMMLLLGKPRAPIPENLAVIGPTVSPTAWLPSPTVTALPRPTGTSAQVPMSVTPLPTLAPSPTPSVTVTPEPTPVWARVSANIGGGAFVREEPDGRVLTSLLNDTLVQVISDPAQGRGGVLWVKVRTQQGVEGWMVQALLVTATPMPGW